MRILKLRLQNLNSLQGEWSIDFTHPDYQNEGLFAITGPTGAGKSTILDAICLALYGQTPRLGKITKSDNDIMSRHSGECMAEVVFSVDPSQVNAEAGTGGAQGPKQYRAYWYQHRARRKAGEPLQSAKHELSNAQTGEVLEEKVSQVPPRIEALTGLDFNRFTRSMMLAQGQFAAFLNADEGERSALLEQMTGTEIYAQISQQTHARNKQEQDILQQLKRDLGGIAPLADDERAAQQAHLAATQKALQVAEQAYEKERQQAQAVQRFNELQREQEKLTASQHEHERAEKAFADDAKRLQVDAKARPMAPALQQIDYMQQQLTMGQQELMQSQQQLPSVQQQASDAVLTAQQSEQQWRDGKAQWQRLQGDIAQARKLDQQLELARQREHLAKQQLEHTEAKQSALTEQLRQLQQEHDRAAAQQQQLKDWLEQHQAAADLAEQLPWLENLRTQLEKAEQQKKALQHKQTELEQELQRLQQLPSTTALAQQQEELERQLQHAQQQQNTMRDKLQQHRLEQELEVSLADLRAELKAGEPCPLCGAMEHPFAEAPARDNVAPANEQQGLRLELVDQEAEPQVQHQGQHKVQEELERAIAEHGQVAAEAQQALQQLAVKKAVGDTERSQQTHHLKARLQEIAQQQSQLEGEQQALQEGWDARMAPFHALATAQQPKLPQLQALAQQYREQQASLQAAQQECHGITQQQQQGQQHKAELAKQHETEQTRWQQNHAEVEHLAKERAMLLQGVQVEQVERQWQTQLDTLEATERQAREHAAQRQQAFEQTKQNVHQQSERLYSLQQQITEEQQALTEALQAAGFADQEALRNALLNEREAHELAARQQQLAQQAALLKADEQRVGAALAQIKAQLPDDEQANQRACEALKKQLNELNQSLGAVQTTLQRDDELRAKQQQALAAIAEQQAKADRWARLNTLIGSADGKNYRNFAQGLTFEIMIDYANQKLKKMTERYLLVRDSGQPLKLNVLDDYQGGEMRSTRNLSGGESFLVSLALALGLAQMASSKVRVDSLFLDEGFGTLDDEALDQALDTLASLRQDGKIIGLISHVGPLKERIATQLQVVAGTAGRSSLQGPGVTSN